MNRDSKKAVIMHKNGAAILFIIDDRKIMFELTDILVLYNLCSTYQLNAYYKPC